MANSTPQQRWTIGDSLDTYAIRNWGAGYFGINDKGNVCVHPGGPDSPNFDLKDLVDEVRRRGISLPLLIRFTDVLRDRVGQGGPVLLHVLRASGPPPIDSARISLQAAYLTNGSWK